MAKSTVITGITEEQVVAFLTENSKNVTVKATMDREPFEFTLDRYQYARLMLTCPVDGRLIKSGIAVLERQRVRASAIQDLENFLTSSLRTDARPVVVDSAISVSGLKEQYRALATVKLGEYVATTGKIPTKILVTEFVRKNQKTGNEDVVRTSVDME